MQTIYLNSVQVNNFGENGAGKFYLHMALPAHCAGKFTCGLFRVYLNFSNFVLIVDDY